MVTQLTAASAMLIDNSLGRTTTLEGDQFHWSTIVENHCRANALGRRCGRKDDFLINYGAVYIANFEGNVRNCANDLW